MAFNKEEQNNHDKNHTKMINQLTGYKLYVGYKREVLHWIQFHNLESKKELTLLPHKGMMVEGGHVELIGNPGDQYLVNYDASYVKAFLAACFLSVGIVNWIDEDLKKIHVFDLINSIIDDARAI